MPCRKPIATGLVLSMVVSVAAPLLADEKEVCLAAADQGQSLRDDSQYSLAREQFLNCAREVCPKLVHDQCTEWLRQLDESNPTVVFGAKDQRGNDVTSARVLSDGKLVTSILDGKPIPLDPGPHDIRFERDPNESVTVHIVLRTGEKNRDVVASLPGADGQAANDATGAASAEQRGSPAFAWNARTVTSTSLLAGATVAVGLGVFFAVQSQNEKSAADGLVKGLANSSACNPPSAANRSACDSVSHRRDAQNNDAVLNEAFYIAGGALAVGAVATWFLWPKPSKEPRPSAAWVAPIVAPTQAGIRVGGAF